jgi:hypothetical protein
MPTEMRTYYYFSGPVSSSAQLNAAVSGSSQVTVAGLNFGYQSYSASAQMGNNICATTAWSSLTSVSCSSSSASDLSHDVVLTVGANAGTLVNAFSFDGNLLNAYAQRSKAVAFPEPPVVGC